MALLHVDFFSDVLGMCTSADVILPQQTSGQIGMEGKGAEGKLKTMYLLHGMSDDQTILAAPNLYRALCEPAWYCSCYAHHTSRVLYRYNLWNALLDLYFRGTAQNLQRIFPADVG